MVCHRQHNNKQSDTINYETETIKWSLCDYSDASILVTGNITAEADNNTDIAFKNCAPFSTCTTKLMIYLLMKQIIFISQCLCTSGSLWHFKRDEVPDNNAELTIDNFQSFKYKAALLGKQQVLLIIQIVL